MPASYSGGLWPEWDRATNSALVVDRVARIVDNLYYIPGMEIFQAAQAEPRIQDAADFERARVSDAYARGMDGAGHAWIAG